MSTRSLRWTEEAEEDLIRLYGFLAEKDVGAARRARVAIRRALELAKTFPYMCRKVSDDPFLRELVISFGGGGYVAVFRIGDGEITVIGIRHQREDDLL